MNSGRKLFFIILFLGSVLGAAFAQEEAEKTPAVNWKMALLKKNGSAYESLALRRPLTMTRKDSFQIYLAFDSTGYCYVVQENDAGKLPLVYRKTFSPGDRLTLPPGSNLPDESRNFKAAELIGANHFYVIVSAQPRQNLERLMDQYEQEPGTPALERSILSEVLATRRSITSRTDIVETPVSPTKSDRAMKGQLWLFEGRDAWVITVVVRIQ